MEEAVNEGLTVLMKLPEGACAVEKEVLLKEGLRRWGRPEIRPLVEGLVARMSARKTLGICNDLLAGPIAIAARDKCTNLVNEMTKFKTK
jgi:hypothetical protein